VNHKVYFLNLQIHKGSDLNMLSFSYYLHEKSEESRHNEAVSFLIAVIGSVFLIGGILQTLLTVQKPQWFLIFPYQLGTSPYDFLGLAFTVLGVMLFLIGIVLAVHYRSQRLWYSNELKEIYQSEEGKLRAEKSSENKESKVAETPKTDATQTTKIR
jgi:uncharacterized membrane protein HdeD (DUF308 family)